PSCRSGKAISIGSLSYLTRQPTPNARPAMISYLSAALVMIGLVIHIAALAPTRRLIAMLPAGSLRNKWFAMIGLILVFIASYLGFIIAEWNEQTDLHDLIVPCVFLFGAVFVWLTANLSLQTAVDLRRISLLEMENITDPLTQVYNRRYLDRKLEEEVARAKRYSLDLSILMLDIDHFKRINDTYGHHAGDVTLSTFGSLIKTALREMDVVARYGGEEFLVICVNTAIDGATVVAERLRHLVESHQVEIPDDSGGSQTIQINISVGAAGLSAALDSKNKLVQAADQALYRAKKAGRNRVIVAVPEAMEVVQPQYQ
ncbi:MAG: GGDEF domain-containing protein, partial [Betaproteobacteria bacterium]|nr:GGDEF domain-containing protein [Betaproteobacteria bacterium]